jgi:hypothetical protein
MSSERKVTFDLPSIDYVHVINLFQAEVDALLVAHDIVMNQNFKLYNNSLEKLNSLHSGKIIDIVTFNLEKTRIDNHWFTVRDTKYNRLCFLLDNVEEKYSDTDPMFKGMSRRLPWLKMVDDLKSQPLEYFRYIKHRSKKLERKFYSTVL